MLIQIICLVLSGEEVIAIGMGNPYWVFPRSYNHVIQTTDSL